VSGILGIACSMTYQCGCGCGRGRGRGRGPGRGRVRGRGLRSVEVGHAM